MPVLAMPVLAMPNMEPNQEIEALAGSRNVSMFVSMFWGDPSRFVDCLVRLAIDRKIHVTPTPASIAAQVQLVQPGLAFPLQAPAGLDAPELHIHVKRLHIHVPQGGLPVLEVTADWQPKAAPRGSRSRTAARIPWGQSAHVPRSGAPQRPRAPLPQPVREGGRCF